MWTRVMMMQKSVLMHRTTRTWTRGTRLTEDVINHVPWFAFAFDDVKFQSSQIAWSWSTINSHGLSVGSRRAEKTMSYSVTPKHSLAQNALAKFTVLFLIASCTCSSQRLGTIHPESRHRLQYPNLGHFGRWV